MRTLTQIKEYVAQLEQDPSHVPEVIATSMDILTHITTPQQFVAELQSKRNLASHNDETYLQKMKTYYNSIINYADEDDSSMKGSWETQEVINWLINNESTWADLKGRDADEIEEWVKQGNAPDGLYTSFRQPPGSSFDDVDWEEVAESLAE